MRAILHILKKKQKMNLHHNNDCPFFVALNIMLDFKELFTLGKTTNFASILPGLV